MSSRRNIGVQRAVDDVFQALEQASLVPRSMDQIEWIDEQPLAAIERVMNECSGAVILGFARYHFSDGKEMTGAGERALGSVRLPTVWNHIEAALAHARKLPLLVLVEHGVRMDGMLEASHGWDVHTFQLGTLRSAAFEKCLTAWRGRVEAYRLTQHYRI